MIAERRLPFALYGRLGLLARVRLDEADASTLPWSAVREMRDGVIVAGNEVEPPDQAKSRKSKVVEK